MSETPELPQPKQPHPALRRLDRLVGRWSMEGHLVGSDETNIRGETSFRWLPGGFFLEQRGTVQGDKVTISVSYGVLDATFTGSSGEDGTFSGGWRPNPGADETVNVPYDIGGARLD